MYLTPRFFALLAITALLAAVAYWLPALYPAAIIVLIALVALTIADAITAFAAIRVKARRTMPQLFCIGSKNKVSIEVESEAGIKVHLRIQDELPPEMCYHDAQYDTSLSSRETATYNYTLEPKERGKFSYGDIIVFARTPLQLIERKIRIATDRAHIEVYPNFKRLEHVELAAISTTQHEGEKRQLRPIGQTDFEHIRDYVPGDEYRHINWKATARTGRLEVNTYQEQRAQNVMCIIDKGRTMQRTFNNMALLDHAINSTLALSYCVLKHHDMAGTMTFDAKIDTTVPPSQKKNQIKLILRSLYDQQVTYSESDFSPLPTHLDKALHSRSLVVLFTDFNTLNQMRRQLPYFRMIARKHCLLIVFFRDKEVEALADITPSNDKEYKQQAIAENFILQQQTIAAELRQNGIYSLHTTVKDMPANTVRTYLTMKQQGVI